MELEGMTCPYSCIVSVEGHLKALKHTCTGSTDDVLDFVFVFQCCCSHMIDYRLGYPECKHTLLTAVLTVDNTLILELPIDGSIHLILHHKAIPYRGIIIGVDGLSRHLLLPSPGLMLCWL